MSIDPAVLAAAQQAAKVDPSTLAAAQAASAGPPVAPAAKTAPPPQPKAPKVEKPQVSPDILQAAQKAASVDPGILAAAQAASKDAPPIPTSTNADIGTMATAWRHQYNVQATPPPVNDHIAGLLDNAAHKYGINPLALRTLAGIESGGGRNTGNSSAGARGVLQLMPATFKGLGGKNIDDPAENIDRGAYYYSQLLKQTKGDQIKAAMGYNMGGGGLSLALRKGYGSIPEETRKYAAAFQLGMGGPQPSPVKPPQPSPAAPAPKPTAIGLNDASATYTGAPPKAPAGSPHAWKPASKDYGGEDLENIASGQAVKKMVGKGGILPTIGALTDVDFVALGAAQRAITGHPEMNASLAKDFLTKPAETLDKFGIFSRPQLEYAAKHDKVLGPLAGWYLQHPRVLEATDFAANLVNPVGDVIGKGFSMLGGFGLKLAEKFPVTRYLKNWASPFKDLATATEGGTQVKHTISRGLMRIDQGKAVGSHVTDQIFRTSTREQQKDIVQASQGALQGPLPPVQAAKAAQLRAELKAVYAEKVRRGYLSPHQPGQGAQTPGNMAADPETFFPMKNAYANPTVQGSKFGAVSHDPFQQQQILQQKAYIHMGQSRKSGKLDPEWTPAENMEKYLQKSHASFAADDMFSDIAQRHPTLFSDKPGTGLIPISSIPALKGFNSTVLQSGYASDHFAQWLVNHQHDMEIDPDRTIHSTNAAVHFMQDLNSGNILGRFNDLAKAAVIVNPLVHDVGNIPGNAVVAGKYGFLGKLNEYAQAWGHLGMSSVDGLAAAFHKPGMTSNAVANLMAQHWSTHATEHAKDIADAIHWGAIAEHVPASRSSLQGVGARIRTLPFSDLTGKEKADKVLSSIWDWNSGSVKINEREAGARLFKTLTTKRGFSPEDASYMVREAMGNYANVGKDGPDNVMNKLNVFYGWMKSNTALHMRALFTNPNTVVAPLEAARQHNQAEGDPDFASRPDFQVYKGQDPKSGKVRTDTIGGGLLPQRVLAPVAKIVDSLVSGDPTGVVNNALSFEEGHLKQYLKPVLQALQGQHGQATDPNGPYGGYTMADKIAPKDVQRIQSIQYAAAHGIPLPGASEFFTSLQQGKSLDVAAERAFQGMSGQGVEYEKMNPAQQHAYSRIRSKFTGIFYRLQRGVKAGTISQDTFNRTAWPPIYAAYQKAYSAIPGIKD